ncbi:hypothetical protein [Deinococcus detaillensis]|nr:hypothetical protein [Deinococcus detaillensis]
MTGVSIRAYDFIAESDSELDERISFESGLEETEQDNPYTWQPF